MGKLDNALIYLSGSIEMAPDDGVAWRRKFIAMSKEHGLKIKYIDPTNKAPTEDKRGHEDKNYQENLQKAGRFEELKEYVGDYRRYDLRACDHMHALVAFIDPDIPHWGTPNEIYVAETAHKPRFAIVPGGPYRFPRWLFDVIPLDNVFSSLEECIERLFDLDQGKIPLSDEWVFLEDHFILS